MILDYDEAVGSWSIRVREVHIRTLEVFGTSEQDAFENAKMGHGDEIGELEFDHTQYETMEAEQDQDIHFRIREVEDDSRPGPGPQ
jgi:hypothetical protein